MEEQRIAKSHKLVVRTGHADGKRDGSSCKQAERGKR